MSDGNCQTGEWYPINGPDAFEYQVSLGCLSLACDAGDCIGICAGACCLGNVCSEDYNVIQCAEAGGVFLGSGSTCSGVDCGDYLSPVSLSAEVAMPWEGEGGGQIANDVAAGGGLLVAAIEGAQVSGQPKAGPHIYSQTGSFVERVLVSASTGERPLVDTDGDRVVVAVGGVVHIYTGSSGFSEEQSVTPDVSNMVDVAISGDRIMVAGRTAETDVVVEYVWSGGSWSAGQALDIEYFVEGVDIDASVMAVSDSYRVYVYERSGDLWSLSETLFPDGSDKHVSVSNHRILLGETGSVYGGGSTHAGQARVFVKSGAAWVQEAVLVPVDIHPSDHYADAVAIDGDVAVVTAPSQSGAALRGGSAVVFERVDGSWVQTNRIYAINAIEDMGFGSAVGVTGRSVIAGWHRVEDWWTIFRGAQTTELAPSSWSSSSGGAFDANSNWLPSEPAGGSADISLPASFDVSVGGDLEVDALGVGTSRPRFTGEAAVLGPMAPVTFVCRVLSHSPAHWAWQFH